MQTVLHQELEKPVSTPTKNTQQPMIMTVPKPLPTSDNTPKIRHFDFSTDECHHYPVDMLVKDFALDILAVFPLYGHFDCLFCRIIHRQVS